MGAPGRGLSPGGEGKKLQGASNGLVSIFVWAAQEYPGMRTEQSSGRPPSPGRLKGCNSAASPQSSQKLLSEGLWEAPGSLKLTSFALEGEMCAS